MTPRNREPPCSAHGVCTRVSLALLPDTRWRTSPSRPFIKLMKALHGRWRLRSLPSLLFYLSLRSLCTVSARPYQQLAIQTSCAQLLAPQLPYKLAMSVYSGQSSRTSSTKTSKSSSAMSTTPYRTSTPPPITALPSFTHSLSAFPSMTSVTSDMVHYGTLGRTKSVSEARVSCARSLAPGARQSF